MIDLTTDYLGLKLRNPLVVSSTPLSGSMHNVRLMEDFGASAIILASLFEEQLNLESSSLNHDLSRGTESYAESLSYLPDFHDYRADQDTYLEHLLRVKRSLSIPVLASINGITPGGWTSFASDVESAGADAIELNTYSLATDPRLPGGELEQHLIELVRHVRLAVQIPVSVKLSPQFTSIPNLVSQLEVAGVNGVSLFNRFYQPQFDIENLKVVPKLSFSSPEELLLRLHWVAILFGRTDLDLAVTGGVHSAEDVLKAMMAGAKVAMMASALHLKGLQHLSILQDDLIRWMVDREYGSISQMRGSLSRIAVPDTLPFERGNYIKTLSSYSMAGSAAV